MRLALVCGLAEMLTVAAIRDATPEDGPVALCLYGAPISMPPDLRRQSLEDARLFGPWETVIDAVDREPSEALADLNPATVLTHTLGGRFETGVFDLFPDAGLVFFDNGLVSHLDLPLADHAVTDKKAVSRGVLARVERTWLTFLDVLPTPSHLAGTPLSPVPPARLRQVARLALERLPAHQRPAQGIPARLILGTAFYRTRAITHEEERAVYRTLVDALRAESGAPILYKEHPRANLSPLLSEADGVEIVQSRLPVEVWAEARPIIEAFSMSSTALLALNRFYGVPTAIVGADHAFPPRMAHIGLMRAALAARR